jgi:hypothetical protein
LRPGPFFTSFARRHEESSRTIWYLFIGPPPGLFDDPIALMGPYIAPFIALSLKAGRGESLITAKLKTLSFRGGDGNGCYSALHLSGTEKTTACLPFASVSPPPP